ncbi:S-adenosyl-L-methionine-dependent methyltransferase,Histidine N-alpha- [Cinara cedri]|uniref:S-adenosyl-L-methionine-dependent methyltransferase,Histidine N-alpha n=1 Tax=Cinara cedri TaxID=506608 RepID=A0A5E4MKB0_9HEMI|nr:S-adenosyl-L-methionine-dependent methyltransferase,Histidine N-alpha- [Cinara cedri]
MYECTVSARVVSDTEYGHRVRRLHYRLIGRTDNMITMRFSWRATAAAYRPRPSILVRRREISTAADPGDDLRESLSADSATISSKYLYDPLGSKLFELICYTPEYYLTRTEAAIFDRHAEDMATAVGAGVTFIDLGAGNCAKAARLLPLFKPRQYVPVDISTEFLKNSLVVLQTAFPALDVQPLAMDFSSTLQLPPSVGQDRRLFFYPGSSFGNFSPIAAVEFLRTLRRNLRADDGGLLMGIDLVKDKIVIDQAYSDSLGITAAFNRNVLLNVNRLIDADFDVSDWEHRGFFHLDKSRVEMHLEAKRDVTVTWRSQPDGSRRFRAGERIHTENSYKYTTDSMFALLDRAGFAVSDSWFDPHKWFMVLYAKPV